MTNEEILQQAYETQLARLFDKFVNNRIAQDPNAAPKFKSGVKFLNQVLIEAKGLLEK